ncbi:leucyl-tRNA synthetase [Daldinia decipiens]|uniref:leucyl-tRNA synthetase n=1 Tax=Daldinia decipiens TaxID=326647 RepID=UPI0020C20BF9|nr:leucyl-tRNA synthetase [Daldinia decipiens]KAI1657815.1 leucyl-tRNA synthetase [Daldinia decipiens]
MADPLKIAEGLQNATLKDLKGTEKRDSLIAIEKKYQQEWESQRLFNADAPSTADIPLHSISAAELREKFPKFFGTIAFPYTNGRLHVGHAFSFSKVEFHVGYARMKGINVLWPQGYHCTGLPIKASADKLAKEVGMFGQEFEKYKEEEEPIAQTVAAPAQREREDVTKFTAKKGKAAAKAVKMKYQFQIMQAMGIPVQQIHLFADPAYWLEYFPPLCKLDLSNFGSRIDWRRQFVTTDANPYFDAFVRWQMIRLRELDKIKFGKRHTIYSIKDGQPCMDHDRSEGEGVNPQLYVAIKMRVLEFASKAQEILQGKLPDDAKIYLVPATLRAETMYGQVACFVSPKITYGVYEAAPGEYYVMTERGAKNMAYQEIFAQEGVIKKITEIDGSDLIGSLVNAPLSFHKDGVRVLPMESILETKGTGVVTCVPSDSPDDYATITDLAKKADYYKIQKEWAELNILPIIRTPTSDLLALELVKKLKIASPKDVKQLKEAKELAYKEGFYQGYMLVGDFKGEKVADAKPKVRAQLIEAGLAFEYAEPENKVVSRSGDECTVALMEQYYIDYGEDSWRTIATNYVENKNGDGLNTYSSDARNAFLGVLDWLKQWACARTYGLGSKLPWAPEFLVESLSDSTVYMSYYTVAHFLHSDLFGREKGSGNIAPEQMIDEVWDYIFCRASLTDDILAKSKIPKETLESMRREFEYFYPLDLRASGKDLINNHLTFFLYNHIALFPREYWPKSIRVNGHLQLNGEKMSKSTGNFMTLDDVVKKFGADASRIALADAGDTIQDSNFVEDVADNTILRLHTLREWCEEMAKSQDLRTELNDFEDALFDNEMNTLLQEANNHYEETNYKMALKSCFYDLINAKDVYRGACVAAGIPLNKELVFKYIRLQALSLAPIAPHWSEYIWLEILHEARTIQVARWPEVPEANAGLSAARAYVLTTQSNITSAESVQIKKMAKGKQMNFDPKKPKKLTIFITREFPKWQNECVGLIRETWDEATRTQKCTDKELSGRIAKIGKVKEAMPFVQLLKKRLRNGESIDVVMERKLDFDESKTVTAMVPGLKRAAGLSDVNVLLVTEGSKTGTDLVHGGEIDIKSPIAEQAVPGQPSFLFENIEA